MIEIKNLTKYFWNKKVLDRINFSIEKWKITGFIGDNWAGKSTTMKILATSIVDYKWEILINDKNLSENIEELRPIIGFMPDQYWLYQELTVLEYLEFFQQAYGLDVDLNEIDTILKEVELFDKKFSILKGLSRGMTQRVLLAKALISKPKFLILDEPASWLDPKLRLSLKNILFRLKKEWVTIFISSHILSELANMVDNLIIIDNWVVKFSGTIESFQNSVDHNIQVKTSDDGKLKEILNIKYPNHKITLLEWWIMIEGLKKTNELLQLILDSNIEIHEFSNNSSDIESAYISLTT